MSNYDWVFWLNVTNIALGVVVFLAVLLLGYGVVWELLIRHRQHKGLRQAANAVQATLADDFSHSLAVPELGLTMADGGEHLKAPTEKTPDTRKKPE